MYILFLYTYIYIHSFDYCCNENRRLELIHMKPSIYLAPLCPVTKNFISL